jgi:hypothetical protein
MNLIQWAERFISLRGKPFYLERYPYLRDIYLNHHPHEVYRKASQVGVSTYHLVKSFYLADTRNVKIIYFFPTKGDVEDFSQDRAGGIIAGSEHLKERVGGIQKLGLRQIGDSLIYFRGLLGRVSARAVDADYIILDELDMADEEQRKFALDRVLHSELGWVSELSIPSLPGIGIDRAFERTDGRYWLVKCPGCSFEEPLEHNFPNCVIEVDGEVKLVCPRCKTALDISKGRWVQERPDVVGKAGYHISHLIGGIRSPGYILNAYNEIFGETEKARFYNSILGLPYSGSSTPFSMERLRSLIYEGDVQKKGVGLMGVDVGSVIYIATGRYYDDKIVINNLRRTEEEGVLWDMMRDNNISTCVIDALPEGRLSRQFARDFPGRVYLAFFRTGGIERGVERGVSGAVQVLKVDRTLSLDYLVASIEGDKMFFVTVGDELDIAFKHLVDLRRQRVKDRRGKGGEERVVYTTAGEDHYAFALNYLNLAVRLNPVFPSVSAKGLGKRCFVDGI